MTAPGGVGAVGETIANTRPLAGTESVGPESCQRNATLAKRWNQG
jgi:hypothetical protein